MEKTGPIKDGQFNLYLKLNYEQKLEEELLKTSYGKRIKALEKLGIGITINEATQKYQERFGMSFDKLGNIKLDQETISEIYQENISEVSKKIGINISGLEVRQISQVLSQVDDVEDIKDIKVDGVSIKELEDGKQVNNQKEFDFIKICEEMGIKESEVSLNKIDMKKVLSNLGFSNNELDRYIKDYEDRTINTFLKNEDDVNLIRLLTMIESCVENGEYSNIIGTRKEIESQLGLYKNSKFFEDIKDENGEVNLEKARKFFGEYKEEKESTDLTKKLNKYSTKKTINEAEEKELVEIILVTFEKGNQVQKSNLIGIAKTYEIDILDKEGNLDKDKIEKYGKKIYGEKFSASEILENAEFKGERARAKLDNIERSIKEGHTVMNPQNLEEINKVKAEAKETERRLCSKKEEIVFNVLNSQNALSITDFYKNPKNAKQLIFLFCKFREDEIRANNKKVVRENVELSSKSINSYSRNSVSGIIQKFIMEHRENFEEYIGNNDKLDADKIMELIKKDNLDINRAANNLVAYEQIKKRTDEIENLERDTCNKKSVKRIETLLKRNERLTEEEKNELYLLASNIPEEVFSTKTLQELNTLDKTKFEETFKGKKVERTVGQNSWSSIYFSAAKVFAKGLYALPKMIISKESRKEFMPKIRRKLEHGAEKISDLISTSADSKLESTKPKKGIFSNLAKMFKINKVQALSQGSKEPVNDSQVDKENDVFYKISNEKGDIETQAKKSMTLNKKEETDKEKNTNVVEDVEVGN